MQLHESSVLFHTDDDSIPKGGALEDYQEKLVRALDLVGMQDVSTKLESYVRGAGFTNIEVILKKAPLGPWAKEPKQKVRPNINRPQRCSKCKVLNITL